MQNTKDIVQIIQLVFTTLAIVMGSLWSYFLFIRKRPIGKRAQINHIIFYEKVSKDKAFLHVSVDIANIGEVLLRFPRGFVRIQKIIPFDKALLEKVEKNESSAILAYSAELDFQRATDDKELPHSIQIEPGEREKIGFDFIINYNIKAVKIYSFFDNSNKIGWSLSTIHRLHE